jgi:hypothetical protein
MIGRASAYPEGLGEKERRERTAHRAARPTDTRSFKYTRKVRISEKAVLIEQANGAQAWLPKSQSWFHSYENGADSFNYVSLPQWLAEQKNLIDEIDMSKLDNQRIC